ncbi:MAG: cytochrome P450 [Pseudomonadota bacterium]
MDIEKSEAGQAAICSDTQSVNWVQYASSFFSGLLRKPYPEIPHLAGNLFSGRLTSLEKEGLFETLLAAQRLLENHPSRMCSFWVGNKCVLLITKPQDIYTIKIKYRNIFKDELETINVSNDNNSSILTEEGKKWKEKRDIYTRHLNAYQLSKKVQLIVKEYMGYIHTNTGNEINLKDLFTRFSLTLNVNLLMGIPISDTKNLVRFMDYQEKIDSVFDDPYTLFGLQKKESYFHNATVLYQELIRTITIDKEGLIGDIAKLNKKVNKNCDLMEAKNILADFNLLFFAGVGTNSFVLESLIYTLSQYPQVEKKVRTEIRKELQGKKINFESLKKLVYLDSVIKEVLRLYPPIIFPREVAKSFNLNGLDVKKGNMIFLAPYLTHRLYDVWKNPDHFIPERFTEEVKPVHGSYYPFGLGKRRCPGEQHASMAIKLFIANIYNCYEISLVKEPSDLILKSGIFCYKNPAVACFSLNAPDNVQNETSKPALLRI